MAEVLTIESPAPERAPVQVAAAPDAGMIFERPVLESRYTFDRFVVDQSNRVAFNAARTVAADLRTRINAVRDME